MHDGGVEQLAEQLREAGHRLTAPRRAVLTVLAEATEHLPADRIHELAAAHTPEVNLASVYRTLQLLGELGLAHEVRLGDGRGYWELAHGEDAYHLHCLRCRSVTHHAGDTVRQVRAHLGDAHGFRAESVDLVVHGVCAACQHEA